MDKKEVVFIYVDNMIVRRITDIYTRKMRSLEPEDLQQTVYLHLIERYDKLLKWREEAGIENTGKLTEAQMQYYYPKVFGQARDGAVKYIKKESKHIYKGKVIDDHFYNEERIRAALPFVWQITPTEQLPEHPQNNTILNNEKKYSNKGLALAIMTDIRNAFYDLNKQEQDLLELYFNKGLTYKEIAVLLTTTEEATRKRISRTIEKMLRKLSGPTAYWESEKIKGTQPDG